MDIRSTVLTVSINTFGTKQFLIIASMTKGVQLVYLAKSFVGEGVDMLAVLPRRSTQSSRAVTSTGTFLRQRQKDVMCL